MGKGGNPQSLTKKKKNPERNIQEWQSHIPQNHCGVLQQNMT